MTSFWRGFCVFSYEKIALELTTDEVPSSPVLLFPLSLDVFAMVIFTKQSYRKSTQWFLSITNIWNLQALKNMHSISWGMSLSSVNWYAYGNILVSYIFKMQFLRNHWANLFKHDWLTNLNMQHLMRITYQTQVPDFRAFAIRKKKALLVLK